MSKYLKIFLLAMLAVAMLASTALAGVTRVNHAAGSINTVSLEATGQNRTVTVIGAGVGNTAAISFQLQQTLTSGNLLEITFANGASLPATPFNVCAANNGGGNAGENISIGNATPTAGQAVINVQIQYNGASNANVAPGNAIWLTDASCIAAAATNKSIRVNTTTTAGTSTVRIRNLSAGGIEIDGSTAANLITVQPEYTVAINRTTHTIDYLGTPGNGTQFTVGGNTASSNAAGANTVNITQAANNYTSNSGANNAGLTVGAVLSLQDTQSWQGVSKVYLTASNAACNAANNVAISSSPANTVALTIPAASFNGSGSANLHLCVESAGNQALNTRNITGSVDISVTGTGANDPSATAYQDVMLWNLNGYQAIVPWYINASTGTTYCLVNNGNTSGQGLVLTDVLSSETGNVITGFNLGAVNAKSSGLITAGANSISLVNGNTMDISSVGTDKRYSVRYTITANPQNVSMACIQTDPITGSKRVVPVLTLDGANNPYKN